MLCPLTSLSKTLCFFAVWFFAERDDLGEHMSHNSRNWLYMQTGEQWGRVGVINRKECQYGTIKDGADHRQHEHWPKHFIKHYQGSPCGKPLNWHCSAGRMLSAHSCCYHPCEGNCMSISFSPWRMLSTCVPSCTLRSSPAASSRSSLPLITHFGYALSDQTGPISSSICRT